MTTDWTWWPFKDFWKVWVPKGARLHGYSCVGNKSDFVILCLGMPCHCHLWTTAGTVGIPASAKAGGGASGSVIRGNDKRLHEPLSVTSVWDGRCRCWRCPKTQWRIVTLPKPTYILTVPIPCAWVYFKRTSSWSAHLWSSFPQIYGRWFHRLKRHVGISCSQIWTNRRSPSEVQVNHNELEPIAVHRCASTTPQWKDSTFWPSLLPTRSAWVRIS